ncbi:MAG: response regulator transcription factor [Gammaproteobacteria bacterium]
MKILIVDDSKAMRKIITWNLRQTETSVDKIFEASCCHDALQIIESKQLDLVISDWNMPEMGGLQLLKSLRDANNKVKFGFVVTQMSASIHNLVINAGADFIISNPSSIETFKTQINQSL